MTWNFFLFLRELICNSCHDLRAKLSLQKMCLFLKKSLLSMSKNTVFNPSAKKHNHFNVGPVFKCHLKLKGCIKCLNTKCFYKGKMIC